MAQEPVTIYPISLDKSPAENITDFRPKVLPADAEDEDGRDPKASSAPERADSSASQQPTEPGPSETPAQHPAGKASTPAKGLVPGKRTSS